MLISNANVISGELKGAVLEDTAVRIEGDHIVELGPSRDLIRRFPQEQVFDVAGQYVMPGSICAHTHFYGAFARGLGIPAPAPKDFPEILRRLWWPLDRALDPESIRYSVLPCLVDAIRHGTTTVFDHHASPNAIAGSLDIIAGEVERAGIRAILCYEVTDRDGPGRTREGIAENVRFSNRRRSPLVAAMFGLHAGLTLSDPTLDLCRENAATDTGFHVHVAEHGSDQEDSLARSGLRVVHRLHRHGILGSRTIAAHGVHLDDSEIEILRETGTWLSHQPRSNMNNGVGVAPIDRMLRTGVRVCLGNDGFSNAMWEEWKAAYLVHKVEERDPRSMNGMDLAQIAFVNNGALASQYFPGTSIGKLVAGAVADMIVVDYQPNTPVTAENLPWHIVFGFQPGMVTSTIVAGKLLMKDRQLLTLDEKEISAKAREVAPQVWARYRENVAAIQ